MNTITVSFAPCSPAPANGYNLIWRVLGSSDIHQDAGNFFTSPIIFTDDTNPDGTQYEGFIRSDCTESGESGTVYGNSVPWQTDVEPEPTACENGCGRYSVVCNVPEESPGALFWYYTCAGDYLEGFMTDGQDIEICMCDDLDGNHATEFFVVTRMEDC